MTVEAALVAALTSAWIVLEARASPREPHGRMPGEVATGLGLLAVHAAGIAEDLARGGGVGRGAMFAGGLVVAAGIALRIAAIRALGPRFSSARAVDRVVASGPYRWLRHPSELGLLAAAAGTAVMLGSGLAAAIAAGVLVPLSISRCQREDRLLAAAT